MGNVRYIYFEKVTKGRVSDYPGEIFSVDENTGKINNMTFPEMSHASLRNIHRIPGGTYISDPGYILVNIEKQTSNYILNLRKSKIIKWKNRKIDEDLENIAKKREDGLKWN